MLRHLCLSAVSIMASLSLAQAQETTAKDDFVEANVLAILYHELGHAVIDLMEVPIFGQEEDAADVMSILLIDLLFTEDAAQDIAYDSAFGFINDAEQTEEVAYWDLHGPDEQRYYNHICLFYGANPDERDSLALDLGLPEERAETCSEEYDQAESSWGDIFDEMDDQSSDVAMVLKEGKGANAAVLNQLLRTELHSLNDEFNLPEEVVVKVMECDEPNAFYDPQDVTITFCTEFIPHLKGIYDAVIVK